MAQMTAEQITAALEAGIISAAQAETMLVQLEPKPSNNAAIGDEENLRFIRGFSDIFIAIGVGLLMLGLSAMAAIFGGGIVFIGAAVLAALMAEYFGRKKRSHLPTLITALAFLIFTLKGASSLFGASPLGGNMFVAMITLIAMGLFYWRVRLPLSLIHI